MSQAEAEPKAVRKTSPKSTDVLKALQRPRVLITLLLGFGSGLPFLLVGNTFSLWLREVGVTLSTIGFLSWVGLAYSFKFAWAPLVDKFDAPFLGFLGRRRSWIVLAQVLVGLSLVAMAMIGPEGGLTLLAAAALVTAFASATQDIVVDAWRIETAENNEDLGLLTAAYQLGYRTAILAANALILYIAVAVGWNGAYAVFGAMMLIPLAAALFAREPQRQAVEAAEAGMSLARRAYDAIIGPFIAFLKTHGAAAVLMLAAISLYRLPDFVMGPMVGPFYIDLGLEKETIASMRLSFGLVGTFLGIAAGGVSAIKLGFGRTLLVGAIIGPGSNLAYTVLAVYGLSTPLFGAVLFTENFSEGFAGAALVAYMSSLTSLGYTATQYALLSSFYALLGKVLKGLSGVAVETLGGHYSLMTSYAIFFACTAAVGIPAVLLCLVLNARHRKAQAELAPAPA